VLKQLWLKLLVALTIWIVLIVVMWTVGII